MIGVVVWSCKDRKKAVIWCEDQASLAYLQGSENLNHSPAWPQPGDLVELESETIGELRHARNVQVLSEQGCASLPEILRNSAEPVEPHLRVVSSTPRPVTKGRSATSYPAARLATR